MVTKNFIITKKGREDGYTDESIYREVNQIVCATEYDYNGQSSLYANSYFKDGCLVGVKISANNESEIDAFTKYMIERGYLIED